MKQIVFISLACFLLACVKPEDKTPTEIVEERKVENVLERYPSGKKKLEGKLVNGERHGKWIYYYDNGYIWSEGKFWYGKRKGFSTVYYENGNRQIAGEYKNDLKVGIWRLWNEDGTLEHTLNLDEMLSKEDSLKLELP